MFIQISAVTTPVVNFELLHVSNLSSYVIIYSCILRVLILIAANTYYILVIESVMTRTIFGMYDVKSLINDRYWIELTINIYVP